MAAKNVEAEGLVTGVTCSGASGESDPSVRESLMGDVGVVDAAMVTRTEQDHVGHVGSAALGPRFQMVGLGPRSRGVAVLGLAALVA